MGLGINPKTHNMMKSTLAPIKHVFKQTDTLYMANPHVEYRKRVRYLDTKIETKYYAYHPHWDEYDKNREARGAVQMR